MTGYICRNCKFRRESEKPLKICPYCDNKSMEKEKTAEELVQSIGTE